MIITLLFIILCMCLLIYKLFKELERQEDNFRRLLNAMVEDMEHIKKTFELVSENLKFHEKRLTMHHKNFEMIAEWLIKVGKE